MKHGRGSLRIIGLGMLLGFFLVSVWTENVRVQAQLDPRPDTPPIASLISVSRPDNVGIATVIGQAGTVEANAFVYIINLNTGDFASTKANANGGFSANIFAPEDADLQIGYGREPIGDLRQPGAVFVIGEASSSMAIIHVDNVQMGQGENQPFTVSRALTTGHWIAEGTLNGKQFLPGDQIEASANLKIISSNFSSINLNQIEIHVRLGLKRLFDEQGQQMSPVRILASSFLTATGLPIESDTELIIGRGPSLGGFITLDLLFLRFNNFQQIGNAITANFTIDGRIPSNMPGGLYRPVLDFVFFKPENAFIPGSGAFELIQESEFFKPSLLPVIQIAGGGQVSRPPQNQSVCSSSEKAAFEDDFEDGNAFGWQFPDRGSRWQVEQDDNAFVLSGEEHGFAILRNHSWDNYCMRTRLKLLEGAVHLNFRFSNRGRYFIGIQEGGVSLSKSVLKSSTPPPGQDPFSHMFLDDESAQVFENTWHTIEIVGQSERIQIFVDGVLALSRNDSNPQLLGGISFETLDRSHVHFDEVQIFEIEQDREIGNTFQETAAKEEIKQSFPSPQLSWMLLAGNLSEGTRGTKALDDEAFEIGPRVTYQADKFIVPLKNQRTGEPITYRLEPFLPLISLSTRPMHEKPTIAAPTIPFKFPSGQLNVEVQKPDGSVDILGFAPFQGGLNPMLTYRPEQTNPNHAQRSIELSYTNPGLADIYTITTLNERFNYQFSQYGKHIVTMKGSIEDIWGNVYRGGGNYEIYVAKPLDLDLGTFLGTPFEVGNAYSPTVHIQPGVSADVEIKFKLYPNSSLEDVVEWTIKGKANRFGYFHPSSIAPIMLSQPGEYQVDISVRYVDEEGIWWMGSLKGASIVETPDTSLIAHGERGIRACCGAVTNEVGKGRPAWFIEGRNGNVIPGNIDGANLPQGAAFHVAYPYHRGDIMWLVSDGSEGSSSIFPTITIQDGPGTIADLIEKRLPELREGAAYHGQFPNHLRPVDRRAIGELPLVSSSIQGLDPGGFPEAVDQFGYFYSSAVRQGVSVRQFVSESTHGTPYWFVDDHYNLQLGSGVNGDLPNDWKLLFGGAVFRDLAANVNQYVSYASMAVFIPLNTPMSTRVTPPFQGAAGGLSGGPIMMLQGKEIDLFFHPTGTGPGSILQVGDTLSFSGQVLPTLDSKVEVIIVTPSGQQRIIKGQANKIGYFYQPEEDFVVAEPGVYTVKVKTIHDGMTSAGPVQPPFPTGDVLGSRGGEFYVYVVEKDSQLIQLTPDGSRFVSPAQPLTITGEIPADINDPQVYLTVRLPGFILEEKMLKIESGSFSYTYNPILLNRDFPNLDVRTPGGQPDAVDTIIMNFLVDGTNDKNQPVSVAHSVTLQGDLLYVDLSFKGTVQTTEPDSDGDGVPDDDDFCPNFPGKPEANGC